MTGCVSRSGGDEEVVHYSSIGGVPSSVEAQDMGVASPLMISGSLFIVGGPTPSTATGPPSTSDGENTVFEISCCKVVWILHSHVNQHPLAWLGVACCKIIGNFI